MVRKWPALALIGICLGLCSLGLGLVMSHALAGYDVEILYWWDQTIMISLILIECVAG